MRNNWLIHVRIVSWLALLLLLASCGGSGSSPAGPPPTIISGLVQAPGGQVAFQREPGVLLRFAELFAASAHAAVSGLTPVADSTVVELGRINAAGGVTRLGTTTTANGRYSFNLTSLGLDVASDLVVRILNGTSGAQLRAFVSGSTANIDPTSESAVRMVLEQLAASQGSALNDFAVQEIRDLVTGLELLTNTIQVAAGPTIETAVSAIRQAAASHAGLAQFLTAAALPGVTSEGPGDIGNYLPLNQGNVWQFEGVKVETGQQASSFRNSVRVTGTKTLGALTAKVVAETNPDGLQQAVQEYLVQDSRGVSNHGNDDVSDVLTPQLLGYRMLRFPLQTGTLFEAVNKTGLNFGDLDGDGRNETGSVLVQVSVAAFEAITVPVGAFVNSAKIETRIITTVTASSNGVKVTVTATQTDWLAPGIGPVRRQTQTSGEAFSETITEELSGYFVDGQGKGAVSLTIAKDLANANSNESAPGKPGLAGGAANYLAVSCRDLGPVMGLTGALISGASAGEPFLIATGDCSMLGGTTENSLSQPSVGFDGTNYLVVFVKGALIRGVRVSPSGAVLDAPSGFAISTGQLFVTSNTSPALAFDGSNFLVVWNKFLPVVGAGTRNLYGARVSPAGQALGEFAISPELNTPDQLGFAFDLGAPSIDFDGSNHMIVWSKIRSGPGSSAYSTLFAIYFDVLAARVTPQGSVVDSQGFPIATSGPFLQSPAAENVQVAFDGTNHLATWRRAAGSGPNPAATEIRGARFSPGGNLLDGPASAGGGLVINATALAKSEPVLGFDGANFLVAWVVGDFPNYPPAGIFGARVSPGGQVIEGSPDTAGIALSAPPRPFARFFFPVLRANGANLLLAWLDNVELQGQTKSIEGALIFR